MIHDCPSLQFKACAREARSKAKLCELYSYYLDDFAFNEDVYGKSLLKVCKHRLLCTYINFFCYLYRL
jgi:hypothetical protein